MLVVSWSADDNSSAKMAATCRPFQFATVVRIGLKNSQQESEQFGICRQGGHVTDVAEREHGVPQSYWKHSIDHSCPGRVVQRIKSEKVDLVESRQFHVQKPVLIESMKFSLLSTLLQGGTCANYQGKT